MITFSITGLWIGAAVAIKSEDARDVPASPRGSARYRARRRERAGPAQHERLAQPRPPAAAGRGRARGVRHVRSTAALRRVHPAGGEHRQSHDDRLGPPVEHGCRDPRNGAPGRGGDRRCAPRFLGLWHGRNRQRHRCDVHLETARILAQSGLRPRRTVRFVLFTGEEQGLIGSRKYAEAHAAEAESIQAVIVLDNGTGAVTGQALQGRKDLESLWRRSSRPWRGCTRTQWWTATRVGPTTFRLPAKARSPRRHQADRRTPLRRAH